MKILSTYLRLKVVEKQQSMKTIKGGFVNLRKNIVLNVQCF